MKLLKKNINKGHNINNSQKKKVKGLSGPGSLGLSSVTQPFLTEWNGNESLGRSKEQKYRGIQGKKKEKKGTSEDMLQLGLPITVSVKLVT